MANKLKHPEFSETRKCGHCANKAPMERVTQYTYTVNNIDEKTGQTWEESDCYELLKCPACNKIELRSYVWTDFMEPCDVVYQTLYPAGPKIPRGLPRAITKAYNEALKVRNVSANAYGGLIGRVIDLVCVDRKANGKDLYSKLGYLAKNGAIPGNLMEVADKLRRFRNVGAHAGLGALTVREVPILENMTCALLEYLYSAPFLVEEARATLERLRKENDRHKPAKAANSPAAPQQRAKQ